jgi:hypothetical protein
MCLLRLPRWLPDRGWGWVVVGIPVFVSSSLDTTYDTGYDCIKTAIVFTTCKNAKNQRTSADRPNKGRVSWVKSCSIGSRHFFLDSMTFGISTHDTPPQKTLVFTIFLFFEIIDDRTNMWVQGRYRVFISFKLLYSLFSILRRSSFQTCTNCPYSRDWGYYARNVLPRWLNVNRHLRSSDCTFGMTPGLYSG